MLLAFADTLAFFEGLDGGAVFPLGLAAAVVFSGSFTDDSSDDAEDFGKGSKNIVIRGSVLSSFSFFSMGNTPLSSG